MDRTPTPPYSTPSPQPGPPGAGGKKGMSRWVKLLIGCGVGCGALIVIVVIVLIFGWKWVMSPGEQFPTDRIIGSDTAGVIRLEDAGEDEGARDLLVSMLQKWQQAARSMRPDELPDSMRWMRDLQQTPAGGNAESIGKMLPSETTLVLETRPGRSAEMAPQPALAVNLKMLPRLIKLMIGMFAPEDKVRTETAGDQEFSVFPGGASLAFVGGTIVWTRSDDLMREVLARVEATESEIDTGRSAYAGPEGGEWDLTGAVMNRGDALPYMIQRFGPMFLPARENIPGGSEAPSLEKLSERMEDIDSLRFGLDAVSADLVVGRAVLSCASTEAADAWLARVRSLMPDMITKLEGSGLTVEASADIAGNDVTTTFRLGQVGRGLDTLTHAILERANQEREGSQVPDHPAAPPRR